MIVLKLLTVFVIFFIAQVYTMDINCGSDHKAYVWNCQTLLDNWSLEDNTFYNPRQYNCLWSGATKYGQIACKILEDDSCTLVMSYSVSKQGTTSAGFSGSDLKGFVQDSINQCTSNNEVSSSVTGIDGANGGLCLCNHGSASACGY